MSVARRYEIPVIEDAAEALGSKFKGKALGTFGDLGVYSFNGNKIITTSGGGALVSENEAWIQKAKFLATQARDPAPHYQHSEIGFNYRLSNICAGIGRGQLEVLEERVRQRRANFSFYQNGLRHLNGVSFQSELSEAFSNRWLSTLTFESGSSDLQRIVQNLHNENIETRPLWKPMHLQPVFSTAPAYISGVSEALFDKGLCLPSSSNLTDYDRSRVLQAFL